MISVDTIESFDKKKAEELLAEKNKLHAELDRLAELHQKDKNKQSRISRNNGLNRRVEESNASIRR